MPTKQCSPDCPQRNDGCCCTENLTQNDTFNMVESCINKFHVQENRLPTLRECMAYAYEEGRISGYNSCKEGY